MQHMYIGNKLACPYVLVSGHRGLYVVARVASVLSPIRLFCNVHASTQLAHINPTKVQHYTTPTGFAGGPRT